MLLSGDPGADPGTAGQTGEAGAAGAALSLRSPFTSRLRAASTAGKQRAQNLQVWSRSAPCLHPNCKIVAELMRLISEEGEGGRGGRGKGDLRLSPASSGLGEIKY